MFSCDYNGWADVPEEEREGIDAFEAIRPPSPAVNPTTPSVALGGRGLQTSRSMGFTQRKAA